MSSKYSHPEDAEFTTLMSSGKYDPFAEKMSSAKEPDLPKDEDFAALFHEIGMPTKEALREKQGFTEKKPVQYEGTKRIDLHGMTAAKAIEEAREMIAHCHRCRIKELIIVTGKGIHSTSGLGKIRQGILNLLKTEKDSLGIKGAKWDKGSPQQSGSVTITLNSINKKR